MSGLPEDLLRAACDGRRNAHAPYSGAKVGAAVRAEDGRVYPGCNVENASYGATVCAERVAIQTAVAAGAKRITELVVVTDASPPWPPCGICRQVIAEFAAPSARIFAADPGGAARELSLAELLPHAFTPADLGRG